MNVILPSAARRTMVLEIMYALLGWVEAQNPGNTRVRFLSVMPARESVLALLTMSPLCGLLGRYDCDWAWALMVATAEKVKPSIRSKGRWAKEKVVMGVLNCSSLHQGVAFFEFLGALWPRRVNVRASIRAVLQRFGCAVGKPWTP